MPLLPLPPLSPLYDVVHRTTFTIIAIDRFRSYCVPESAHVSDANNQRTIDALFIYFFFFQASCKQINSVMFLFHRSQFRKCIVSAYEMRTNPTLLLANFGTIIKSTLPNSAFMDITNSDAELFCPVGITDHSNSILQWENG